MDERKALPNFGSDEFIEVHLEPVRMQTPGTETIDLSNLFVDDVSTSGSFDLSGIGATSFGRLLDALPLPALLIDQGHCVAFANQACVKLSYDSKQIPGIPFLHLLLPPRETARAQELAGRLRALLQTAFAVRKPRTAEVILEMGTGKIWARLHLRSVRVGLERHLLVLIEDVTHEKKQLALNRRREEESSKRRTELELQVQKLRYELTATGQQLERQIDDRMQAQEIAENEKRKMEIVCEQAALGTAVLTSTGNFKEMNRQCRELMGIDINQCPHFRDWAVAAIHEPALPQGFRNESVTALAESQDPETVCFKSLVAPEEGSEKQILFHLTRLANGDYFMTCREAGEAEG